MSLDGALCAQTDPELFFSQGIGSPPSRHAIAICQRCPVRDACLAEAIAAGIEDGVWGGVVMRTYWREQRRSA